jgi:hypothetical protein
MANSISGQNGVSYDGFIHASLTLIILKISLIFYNCKHHILIFFAFFLITENE